VPDWCEKVEGLGRGDGGKVSATGAWFAASYEQGAAERMMRPRLLIGFALVLGLAMPSVVMAQRGASGGFAGGGHVAAAPAGTPHPAGIVHAVSGVPTTVPVGNSSVRTRATIHSADVPSRHAGLSSTLRSQNSGNRVFAPIGVPLGGRRNPTPFTTPRVVYLLGVGGYYYAAPGDAAANQPQEAVEQEDQQGDDQQVAADNAGDGERADNRDGGRNEGSAAARAPEQHEEAVEVEQPEQEPLPDVGTLTLVLRDGSHLDVVAFTMTQGQVVYITPEGRRLTISADIFDADATQRVNQERGTPMQLPL
jgi:hypothetical protein